MAALPLDKIDLVQRESGEGRGAAIERRARYSCKLVCVYGSGITRKTRAGVW